MKKLISIAMIILASAFCNMLFAQLSGLAILPQDNIKIVNGSNAMLSTISIDYYATAPDANNTKCNLPYNQVYSNGKIVVRINGKISKENLQDLVGSDNPLLLLQPLSAQKVLVSINPDYKKIKSIKMVELDIALHAEVGNDTTEKDVSQAAMIFKTWGEDISQEKYWQVAQCLDVITASKLMVSNGPYNDLSKTNKALVDILYGKLDFNAFNGPTFKSLVNSSFIIVDKNGDLTQESINHLRQVYYFKQGLKKTSELNDIWQSYVHIPANTAAGHYTVTNTAKSAYYGTNRHLAMLDKSNKAVKDTIINNERYVLMTAWKSAGAFSYIDTTKTPITMTTNPQLFRYAFFLAAQFEMVDFVRKNKMNTWTEEQCRTRLKQLLGLIPNATNSYVFEIWVKEGDIFRPTIDSSYTYAYIPFRLSDYYLYNFAGYASGSFQSPDITQQYPFSGLGCTWDWNPENATHNGVSEFVIKENRTVYIRSFMPTMQYIKAVSAN